MLGLHIVDIESLLHPPLITLPSLSQTFVRKAVHYSAVQYSAVQYKIGLTFNSSVTAPPAFLSTMNSSNCRRDVLAANTNLDWTLLSWT
jgi:hypothetical protein